MPFDDDPDDERPGPDRLLPPEDRLWRHPSELAAGLGPGLVSPSSPGRPDRRSPALTALAGACLAGAVVTFGVMWLARPTKVVEKELPVSASRPATTLRATFSDDPVPTERLASQLAPAVATLRVLRAGAWTTASAVWIDDRGTLAAATPVVAGASRLVVVGRDGTSQTAEVAGADDATGITALTVARTSGTAIGLSRTGVRAGEPAAVIGAHGSDAGQDTDATVASVVVRSISLRASVDDLVLHDAIQLDRQIPVDASGGALVDVDGGLLGMVVGNSTERGLGTVVAGKTVMSTVSALRDDGEVRRAWLGVEAVDLDPDVATLLQVAGGADLTAVSPDSPAAAAGLEEGDVITAIGDDPVSDASDLVRTLRAHDPGERCQIAIRRGTTPHTMTATLGGH